mmetsp:Transcript_101728/g.283399  ORF Transcript_101728/g.283399 Transcript_101728/m.283399 type:complete len:202 (+) Transcript_101728:458-1063(+)
MARAGLRLRRSRCNALLLPLVPLHSPLLDLGLPLLLEERHLPLALQLVLFSLLRSLLLLLPLLVPPRIHLDILLGLAGLSFPHGGGELAVALLLPLQDVLLALGMDPGGGELLLGAVLGVPRLLLLALLLRLLHGLVLLPTLQGLRRLQIADPRAIGLALLLPRRLALRYVLRAYPLQLRIPSRLLRHRLGLLGLARLPRL